MSHRRNSMKKWFDKKSTTTTECDGTELSKCGPINRIGLTLSYYNKWLHFTQKDKLKCGMHEFLHSGLKVIKNKNKNKNKTKPQHDIHDSTKIKTNPNNTRFYYSSVKLLDDYHHILYDHDNDDENGLETVYNYLLTTYLSNICKTRSCNALKRNNRDRWSCSMNNTKRIKYYSGYDDSNQVYILKLCDRIHCTLLHTFDIGYKWNKKDKALINENTAHISANKRLKYIDDVMIKPKRKKIRKVRGSQRYKKNKFISIYDINELEHKEEEKEEEEEEESSSSDESDEKRNTHEYIEYSFGFAYKYWMFYFKNEYFVAAKHKDLRDEMINNNIHRISQQQFSDELKNVIDLINCKKGRSLSCKYMLNKPYEPQFEHIGIDVDSPVTIDHLLCLVFITNYDHLRRKFMATFKKADNESTAELIRRHSEFHHIGKLSFELIHLFGSDISVSDDSMWYHGFDQQMIFADTFLRFEFLTSTTTNLNVALSYANSVGLILALKACDCSYFDCRWMSDYSNESENIFVQNEFKLASILNISLYADYEWYLNILTMIKMMFNGMFLNDIKLIVNDKIYTFLSILVNNELILKQNTMKQMSKRVSLFGAGFISFGDDEIEQKEEEEQDIIHPYVIELFKRYFNDKNGLIINIWSMNIDEFKMFNDENTTYFGYKLIRNLFISDDDEWIYFEKLIRLYSNAELICIYNVDWINGNKLESIKLNDNFANKLLSFLSLDNSALIDIWIYQPNQKDIKIHQFIAKYQAQFEYIKWKQTMQKKQIPGLKEKLGDIDTLCITYKGQTKNDINDILKDQDEDQYDDTDSDSY